MIDTTDAEAFGHGPSELMFAIAGLSAFLVASAPAAVNVAFPAIRAEFPTASTGALSWIVTGYAIAFGGLLIPAGGFADRSGRRAALLTGIGLLLIGSIGAATAPALPVLVAGRVIQGMGAAMLQPSSLALLLATYSVASRAHVVSLWGAMNAAGVMAAPTLGAALIQAGGWRTWFATYAALAATLFAAAWAFVPRTRSQSVEVDRDRLGVLLALSAGALVATALSQGRAWGWSAPPTWSSLTGGLGVAGLFVYRMRTHPRPVVDPDLASRPLFLAANITTFFYAASLLSAFLLNMLFLTSVWGYSVLAAGLATTPAPAVSAALSPLIGRAASRFGFWPLIAFGGAVFATSHVWFWLAVGVEPQLWTAWIPATLLMGVGFGVVFPTVTAAAAATLSGPELASGLALNQTFRQFGGVVGVASLSSVIAGATDLADFRRGWLLCAACATLAALGSVLVRRGEQSGP